MTTIILSGCNGRMGQVITRICGADPELQIVAGFDLNTEQRSTYPVYADPMECPLTADCVIDFSNAKALEGILRFCTAKKIPAVLASTGYSEAQLQAISEAAKVVPLFKSANMSLGINVLLELVKKAAKLLSGYDIEIVEKHHNQKLDAPSGTALMIADAAASAVDYDADYTYERQSVRRKREKNEIGISSVRGGTIVGEHEILFAGPDEIIEIKHTAMSREIFANGAVRAARFLAGVTEPGLYDMSAMIADET